MKNMAHHTLERSTRIQLSDWRSSESSFACFSNKYQAGHF